MRSEGGRSPGPHSWELGLVTSVYVNCLNLGPRYYDEMGTVYPHHGGGGGLPGRGQVAPAAQPPSPTLLPGPEQDRAPHSIAATPSVRHPP